jgi:hypothetical protein
MGSEKPAVLIEARGPQADLKLASKITDRIGLLVLSVRAALNVHVLACHAVMTARPIDAVRTEPIMPCAFLGLRPA